MLSAVEAEALEAQRASEEEERLAHAHALWFAGDLDYLLHDGQIEASIAFHTFDGRVFVACCARRWGKTWWLFVEAACAALRTPGRKIVYLSDTAAHVRDFTIPVAEQILEDCPKELRPELRRVENTWVFPNGSTIKMIGCDRGGADKARGGGYHLAIIDEAGFVDSLLYAIQSVLLPALLTTDGWILAASTPPVLVSHDFAVLFKKAKDRGGSIHRRIYDAPHLSPEVIGEFMLELSGPDSIEWRREGLAEFVTDPREAVLPEFAIWEHRIVGTWNRPPYFTTYVVGDIAYKDCTVVLFAYYDWLYDVIVVERELVFQQTVAEEIGEEVTKLELDLWGKPADHHYVDAHPLTRMTLGRASTQTVDLDKRTDPYLGEEPTEDTDAIAWSPTRKRDKDDRVMLARTRLRHETETHHGRFRIDPSCETTIAHMRDAQWNKSGTEFLRIKTTTEQHHFDGADAGIYLMDMVDVDDNPYPEWHPAWDTERVVIRRLRGDEQRRLWKEIF